MGSSTAMCRCGHDRETHKHFRRGSDCGVCGSVACPRFRRDPNADDRRSPVRAVPAAEPARAEAEVVELHPST